MRSVHHGEKSKLLRRRRKHLLDGHFQVIQVEWLGDVLIGSEQYAFRANGETEPAGKHDHPHGKLLLTDVFEHLEAILLRHIDVENCQMVFPLLKLLHCDLAIRRLINRVALSTQLLAKEFAQRLFIVSYQYSGFIHVLHLQKATAI